MDSFVYAITFDMIGLDKTKQTVVTEKGLGQYFSLLTLSWRICCTAKETAEQI